MNKEDILVLDNVLPEVVNNSFQQNITRLAYILSMDILPNQMDNKGIMKDENTFSSTQMVHRVYLHNQPQKGPQNPAIEPIKHSLSEIVGKAGLLTKDFDKVELLRAKFNLMFPHPDFKEGQYNIAHIDDEHEEHLVCIYYPQDTDGDTVLFNEFFNKDKKPEKLTIAKRVEPKANRCVIFNGWRFHASSNPSAYNNRIVLNTNFRIVNNG